MIHYCNSCNIFFTLFFIKCTIVTVYITTMKRYCIVIITAIVIVLTTTIACYKQHIPSDGVYTVWVHSDIQPTKKSERWHYTRAIDDIVNIKPHPIFAIIAGDIVQHKEAEEDYQWFIELRKKADISYWYEIAGNHEWKNMPAYNTYILANHYDTLYFLGILFSYSCQMNVAGHQHIFPMKLFYGGKILLLQIRIKIS